MKIASHPFGSVGPKSRSLQRTRVWVVAVLALAPPIFVHAGSARPEPKLAKPELSDDDLDALQSLFEKMSELFVRGNSKGVRELLAESRERDALVDTFKQEFREARYLDLQIGRADPSDRLSDLRHSVDVTIRVKVVYLDDARPPDARTPIENTTVQNFIVQREPNGSFTIVNSSFFNNMGRRSGGMRLLVHALGAVIVFCALLAFWVWMASEAWWIRPRSTLWRAAMLLPPLGPLVFFFVRYLPEKWKAKKR